MFVVVCLMTTIHVVAQETTAKQFLEFGTGATISVGLQDEWAVNVRAGYQYERWKYIGEYNLFFRRDITSQNTETYSEYALNAIYKLYVFSGITIFGGVGYVANNFTMYKNNPDTSRLFFKAANFNHGAQLKFLGMLPLGERINLFSELNLKSFGRRYDTFAFGLIYSIPSD